MKTVLVVADPDELDFDLSGEVYSITAGDTKYIFQLKGRRESIQAFRPDDVVVLGPLKDNLFKEEVWMRTQISKYKEEENETTD